MMSYGFTLYGASLFIFMLARYASGVRYGKATHSPTQCCFYGVNGFSGKSVDPFYVERSRLCVYLLHASSGKLHLRSNVTAIVGMGHRFWNKCRKK
jgi:hypothetical protein